MMQKNNNLQDVYLTSVSKNRVITGFDAFTVVLNSDGRQQVIYKHAISTIVAERPVELRGYEAGGEPRIRP